MLDISAHGSDEHNTTNINGQHDILQNIKVSISLADYILK